MRKTQLPDLGVSVIHHTRPLPYQQDVILAVYGHVTVFVFRQQAAYCSGIFIGKETVGIQIIEITSPFLDTNIDRIFICQGGVPEILGNDFPRKISEQAGIGQYKNAVIAVQY